MSVQNTVSFCRGIHVAEFGSRNFRETSRRNLLPVALFSFIFSESSSKEEVSIFLDIFRFLLSDSEELQKWYPPEYSTLIVQLFGSRKWWWYNENEEWYKFAQLIKYWSKRSRVSSPHPLAIAKLGKVQSKIKMLHSLYSYMHSSWSHFTEIVRWTYQHRLANLVLKNWQKFSTEFYYS